MPKKANIFESFSHSAIQQFKEAFGIMDTDKDGLLSSSDLQAAFAAHGKNIGGGEAQVSFSKEHLNRNARRGIKLFFFCFFGQNMTPCIGIIAKLSSSTSTPT